MSQHKAKRAKTKAPAAVLPPIYEELAALHSATLTAVAFLAPKGVLCSLPVLRKSVAALTTHALGVEQLQMMVALDASLGLRHAWIAPAPGAPPEEVLELVLREPLKVASSPGAVRSRTRRFRALLEAAAASDPPIELLLAPLPPPAPAAHGLGAGEAAGGGGFSCAAEQAHYQEEAADATRPSPTAIGEVTGLPSPPPKPLRRVASASARAASASGGGGGGGGGALGAPVTGARGAASAAPELSSTMESEVEAAAAAAAAAAEAEAARAAGRSGCAAFLQRVRETPFYRGQIVHTHVAPAAPPRYRPLACTLAPAVGAALRASGVERLYAHQAAARASIVVVKYGSVEQLHMPCMHRAHAVHAPCTRHARAMHAPCTRHARAVRRPPLSTRCSRGAT